MGAAELIIETIGRQEDVIIHFDVPVRLWSAGALLGQWRRRSPLGLAHPNVDFFRQLRNGGRNV